jgi:hypothetical protein
MSGGGGAEGSRVVFARSSDDDFLYVRRGRRPRGEARACATGRPGPAPLYVHEMSRQTLSVALV